MASRSSAREIGRTYIANKGGTIERGDYVAAVCRRGSKEVPREILDRDSPPKATRVGEVHNYPRLSYNMWRLIIRALKSCFPEEK